MATRKGSEISLYTIVAVSNSYKIVFIKIFFNIVVVISVPHPMYRNIKSVGRKFW